MEAARRGYELLQQMGVTGRDLQTQLYAAAQYFLALALARAEEMPPDRAVHAACEAFAQARSIAQTPKAGANKTAQAVRVKELFKDSDEEPQPVIKVQPEKKPDTAEQALETFLEHHLPDTPENRRNGR